MGSSAWLGSKLGSALASRAGTATLWIATTVGAALLGGWGSAYIERPQPEVIISDVRAASQVSGLPDREVPVSFRSDPVLADIDQNVWIPDVSFDGSIGHAVRDLQNALDSAKDWARDMEAFRAAYPQLLHLVDSDPNQADAEEFLEVWQTVDRFVYPSLKGQIKRDAFAAPAKKDYSAQTRYLLLRPNRIDGRTYLTVSEPGSVRAASTEIDDNDFADQEQEIQYALAYFDRAVLRRYLDEVRNEAASYNDIVSIEERVSKLIQGFSRWSVVLLVTNSGGKPLSFAPGATLYVDSNGAAGFSSYTQIPLVLVDEHGHLDPVTVGGGETKVLEFTSSDIVASLPNWDRLVDLFNSAARRCFIVMHPEGSPWLGRGILRSPAREFGIEQGRDALTMPQVGEVFADRND
jgi:hypothetical protein